MDASSLKVTDADALKILRRLALHYPRSRQGVVLLDPAQDADALAFAADYARDCRGMTFAGFVAAVDAARAENRFFPTSADVRAAHRKAQDEKQRVADWEARQAAQRASEESMTPEQRARSAIIGRVFNEFRLRGMVPDFAEARRIADEEMRNGGGHVQ